MTMGIHKKGLKLFLVVAKYCYWKKFGEFFSFGFMISIVEFISFTQCKGVTGSNGRESAVGP